VSSLYVGQVSTAHRRCHGDAVTLGANTLGKARPRRVLPRLRTMDARVFLIREPCRLMDGVPSRGAALAEPATLVEPAPLVVPRRVATRPWHWLRRLSASPTAARRAAWPSIADRSGKLNRAPHPSNSVTGTPSALASRLRMVSYGFLRWPVSSWVM
jgi:hypothetical protein